jgi:hypothetical protein
MVTGGAIVGSLGDGGTGVCGENMRPTRSPYVVVRIVAAEKARE